MPSSLTINSNIIAMNATSASAVVAAHPPGEIVSEFSHHHPSSVARPRQLSFFSYFFLAPELSPGQKQANDYTNSQTKLIKTIQIHGQKQANADTNSLRLISWFSDHHVIHIHVLTAQLLKDLLCQPELESRKLETPTTSHMGIVSPSSLLPLSQTKNIISSSSTFAFSTQIKFRLDFRRIMSSASKSQTQCVSSSTLYQVPGLDPLEMDSIAEKTFERYSSNTVKNNGKGVSLVWFRNDLRVLDNEPLFKAWVSSEAILPVYCIDPRLFQTTTYHFGFPKTGALRAQFIMECLADLKKNLMKKGLNLLIQHGKPEDILPKLARAFGAHTVYAHKETCSEELQVERSVARSLRQVVLPPTQGNSSRSSLSHSPKLELSWGGTLYHLDDLPFNINSLPDVYTQFRKSVEAKCTIRGCIKLPKSLGPPPSIDDWGIIPSIEQLGLHLEKTTKGMRFMGGEAAALGRVTEYFWKKDLLKIYKETRNGMLGPDYSTKFSPWLASGSLSPRFVYEEVKRYEKERQANDSTYWVLFELIWRDYFRFVSIKHGNSLFYLGGPRKVEQRWRQDQKLFETWRNGCTGYPLIDANMKELSASGFMSNRGRQIVCSFLVRDMGIDWRMGAEWFETCLLDYDPCSNYGNWTYGAGVGNDPREDRYFSIPKQAQTYDPDGEYVAFWLPELLPLPREKRNFPGKSYIAQVVPLKFGNTSTQRSKYGGRQSRLQSR